MLIHLFVGFLLVLVVVLLVIVFVLFHGRMVDQAKWHSWLREELTKATSEIAALKAWVNDHVHLHTAPPSASPAASAASTKK